MNPLVDGIDATLFEDEDGKVYFTYGSASKIALLKDDMSGFAEPFRQIVLENPDHNPLASCRKMRRPRYERLGSMKGLSFLNGTVNIIWARPMITKEDIRLV